MSRKKPHTTSLYEYLESSGVLDTGSDEAIADARKHYWKEYKARWRKQKRKEEKELTTSWTPNELKDLTNAARHHAMSRVAFIKSATIAYMQKSFIVPDKVGVRKIAQLLAMNYNLIQEMIEEKTISLQAGNPLLDRITELEKSVRSILETPKSLEHLLTDAVTKNPTIKHSLYPLLESLP
jgi:hypothetical protein